MTDEIQSTLGTNILMDGIALGEVYDPPSLGASGEEHDTTAQNNPDGIKTKLIGLIEHDNATFNLKYNGSTQQNNLLTEIYDRENHAWSLVLPPDFHGGGHSFPWTGQIKSAKLVHEGAISHIELEVTVNSKLAPITTLAAGLTNTFFTIADDDSNALTPSPAAAAAVYEYNIEAYADNTSITITPTATAGTIRVNDTIVVSGAASTAITLNTGTGAVTMVSITVSELNKTPRIYWLRVYLGPTNHP